MINFVGKSIEAEKSLKRLRDSSANILLEIESYKAMETEPISFKASVGLMWRPKTRKRMLIILTLFFCSNFSGI